jgi:hypothetical protein
LEILPGYRILTARPPATRNSGLELAFGVARNKNPDIAISILSAQDKDES